MSGQEDTRPRYVFEESKQVTKQSISDKVTTGMNSLKPEFEGTWRFANEKEPDGWNYLNFSKGNRVAQFFNIKGEDFECGRMLVSDIGNDTIQFHPEDGSDGWTRKYRFDDGNLVIIEGDDEYPCSRLPDMLPWLVMGIFESESYFDENESNWGNKK